MQYIEETGGETIRTSLVCLRFLLSSDFVGLGWTRIVLFNGYVRCTLTVAFKLGYSSNNFNHDQRMWHVVSWLLLALGDDCAVCVSPGGVATAASVLVLRL